MFLKSLGGELSKLSLFIAKCPVTTFRTIESNEAVNNIAMSNRVAIYHFDLVVRLDSAIETNERGQKDHGYKDR